MEHEDSGKRRLRLLTVVYLALYPVPWFVRAPTSTALLASAFGIAIFLPLYFYSFRTQGWRRLACASAVLGIGFALSPFGAVWEVFSVYAAASIGMARPTRLGVTGVCLVVLSTTAVAVANHMQVFDWAWGVFFSAALGTASIFNAAMNERAAELARAREDARQFALIAERERIARDLHDVLGHTLTLVAVKADLAGKLIDRDPAAARREIEEIHAAARASLGEVRAAVTGMRSTTLAAELVEARRALESAGIALESATLTEPLPPTIETALAYVIREAATNVVRHSGARHCRIQLTRDGAQAELEIQDDGRGGALIEGHGVTGMRQRIAAIRGALDVQGESGMRIRARVPLAAGQT